MSKVYLKNNWAETFVYGDKTPGIYVGREDELQSLQFTLVNNDSASILISSVRGVGKTSFVHKALSGVTKDAHPIFVNAGHVMSYCREGELPKRELLNSLIRSAYFEFKDKEITDLYYKAIGKFKEYKSTQESEEKNSEKEINLTREFNIRHIFVISGAVLSTIGIMSGIWWVKIVGILGTISIPVSFIWKTKWTKKLSGVFGQETVIENSDDYIELLFERWLRGQKDKKLVFVIDELDKITDESKALKLIKEYKNLFSRSFAKFIFITGEDAYSLTEKDRSLKADDGGIFPTLFTHVYYLPLPKTFELKQYLKEIFIENSDLDKKGTDELVNYLLIRSGNDFFELKKLIADVVSYDNNGKTYIETNKIIKEDSFYSKISELFDYVNAFFLDRKLKELKKSWKENTILQKNIFEFLNEEFNKNFDSEKYENENVKDLIKFLDSIGIIAKKDKTKTDNTDYIWTGKYKRNVGALLEETDKEFNSLFRKLIKVANDLDDLPENYKTNKFDKQDKVFKDRDGQDLSGISLYSTYTDYKGLFKALKYSASRITITHEKVKEAKKTIDEQIKNVFEKYYLIFINLLTKIFEDNNDIFKNEPINSANYNINSVFSTLPEILSTITAYENTVFGRIDQSKYVLLIRHFEDEDSVQNSLAVLRNNKNILVVNLIESDKYEISNPKISQDTAGRKRKKAMVVDNFINFKFNDFRQFPKILTKIEDYLTK